MVGIDPGIYTAYAALDLNGKLISSGCEKEASHERIVEIISKLGKPSLIATDVSPPPDFVQKVAARFHARLFFPERSMLVGEKKEIGKEIQNPHVRDALAAATKAYRHYENTLRRIEHSDTAFDKELLKHLFIQGYSVKNAEFLLAKKEEKKLEQEGALAEEKRRAPEQKKRDERLISLLQENENLRKALEMERTRRLEAEEKLRRAGSSRLLEVSRDREVQRLQGQIARMQSFIFHLKKRSRSKRAGKSH
ncbi:MAG: DUF460 domain-containing protein [Candidatus Bilamarchaeaceae archaeon]